MLLLLLGCVAGRASSRGRRLVRKEVKILGSTRNKDLEEEVLRKALQNHITIITQNP